MKIHIEPPHNGIESLILMVAVIFALTAAAIAAMLILFHAKSGVSVLFMIISLIALVSVLIYLEMKGENL